MAVILWSNGTVYLFLSGFLQLFLLGLQLIIQLGDLCFQRVLYLKWTSKKKMKIPRECWHVFHCAFSKRYYSRAENIIKPFAQTQSACILSKMIIPELTSFSWSTVCLKWPSVSSACFLNNASSSSPNATWLSRIWKETKILWRLIRFVLTKLETPSSL